MVNRREMADTIKDAASKAGALLVAALGISCAALLVAAAALLMAVRVRHGS